MKQVASWLLVIGAGWIGAQSGLFVSFMLCLVALCVLCLWGEEEI